MHVLYHHRTAGDRVEAVHIMGIVRALRELGHTVEISGPPGCNPERKSERRDGSVPAKPAEGGLRARLKRFARKAPLVLFELAELVYNIYSFLDILRRGLRRKPDLIYERTTSNSIAPTLLARWRGIPIVQEVNVTVEIGRLRPLALRRLSRRIEKWMVRRATLFVTVSEQFKAMLVAGGFPAEGTMVCQNAVRPEEWDPASETAAERPPNVGEDTFIVGYVGAFVPYHKLDMLIDAAAALAPGHPDVRWLLVGDGVERPRIEALIEERGLRNKFWMPGAVRHELVPAYVKAMDAAVLPSSERFNSPMKLFEYLAMGRPAIVPDKPAIREVIKDGINGILFSPDDPKALTAAVERVLNDADLRRRLGAKARADVLARHTWRRSAKRILARVQMGVSTA